ncbi:vacuole membrane protein KMS1-like isoform X1 [Carex littledalei]|uniref:Vacuole membrane protein KMS1-like isoform X1 n=1 Tax=Carex littledalei TaxID=544730 RepID=A0A833RDL5_9POAL|nr:vacuole membrane protein KMS1-like isoform X1 [Carex littledalei]
MGRRKSKLYRKPSSRDLGDEDPAIWDLRTKQRSDRENLSLATHPIKTFYLFILATAEYLKGSSLYILRHFGLLVFLTVLVVAGGAALLLIDGPHEKLVKEVLRYASFSLWWVALGVASSIGLGSGLHTFVLYLGPHIAFFTIKALQCGRVDLKTAPYDTIQLKSAPSWLEKDCSDFGPPVFTSLPDSLVKIPLSKILPQVQLEAVLWGLGTALGELPPYFISRAASLSGSKIEAMEEFDVSSSKEGSGLSAKLDQAKRWLFSHAQHLNFFTILILASVPNPLFDLAGIMCGQFGIPFWKFFLATMIGKAIIKTHIQTVFIIALVNNQLLELVEKRLIWVLGHIPGMDNVLPKMMTKLHSVKEKYLSAPAPSVSPISKGKQWKFSVSMVWNTIVWLMLVNFFAKIVTSTAQNYLKKQQELELNKKKLSSSENNASFEANGTTYT